MGRELSGEDLAGEGLWRNFTLGCCFSHALGYFVR